VSGISAHSAFTHPNQTRLYADIVTELQDVPNEELDVLHWMKRNRDILPPLRFDCGREDQFIEPNRKLHHDLQAAGIPHVFSEFDGGHSWAYWEQHLRDTLAFFDRLA
jgi:enterochelin esterase-like enzyme